MIILTILLVALLIGYFLNKHSSCVFEDAGIMLMAFAVILLVVYLVTLPLVRIDINSQIAEYKSVESTLNQAREDNNQLENVALQHKIIEKNEWLAGQVYWNSTLFDLCIPDEILELKPLR